MPKKYSLPRYKQPEQMSLYMDEDLARLVLPEHVGESYAEIMALVAYIDNTGKQPKNFPEDSEAYVQWTYSGRKKNSKEVLNAALVCT